MDLAEAVLSRLGDSASVTAIVDDRVYWTRRDQGSVLPAVVLSQISRFRDDGLTDPGDIIESHVQASCMAANHADSWALATAVGDALRDEAEVDGFLFWAADVEGPIDLVSELAAGGLAHTALLDIILRHSADT